VNFITPTSAVVMGGLAIARVSYDRWLRFVWKYLIIMMIIIIAGLAIGVLTG
ncbi:MAG: YfcC family protein, partial [Gracilibacteraceae bacterium]|nr:YfcC family protein [Gracilibacteraceae bacterium]